MSLGKCADRGVAIPQPGVAVGGSGDKRDGPPQMIWRAIPQRMAPLPRCGGEQIAFSRPGSWGDARIGMSPSPQPGVAVGGSGDKRGGPLQMIWRVPCCRTEPLLRHGGEWMAQRLAGRGGWLFDRVGLWGNAAPGPRRRDGTIRCEFFDTPLRNRDRHTIMYCRLDCAQGAAPSAVSVPKKPKGVLI